MFDPTPPLDVKIQIVQQKISSLKQQHYDAVLELESVGVQKLNPDGKKARVAELQLLAANAAKGAEALQVKLDALVKEATVPALGEGE